MSAMQWNNERIMEFLELYQTEPCLWDPKEESYKSRVAQYEAWRRIDQGLQFPSTVEELKRKKESLMAYYRIHLNKYKKALKSGVEASNVYTTSWFAFDLMHSFLRPVYEDNNSINFKISSTRSRDSVSESEASEGQENSSADAIPTTVPIVKFNHQPLQRQVHKRPYHSQVDGSILDKQHSSIKQPRDNIPGPTEQITETCNCVKQQSRDISTQGLDEYDHFALMIAAKIRKINNMYEREILINTIQNMVFQSIMKNKNYTHRTDELPPDYWETRNNESAAEVDIKPKDPIYFESSDTLRSPSPGCD